MNIIETVFMTYKGYTAAVEFNPEDGMFVGRVLRIQDLIDFEGETIDEAEKDFHNAIKSYLNACKVTGTKPDKPRKEKLSIDFPPELSAKIEFLAEANNKTEDTIVVQMMSTIFKDTENRMGKTLRALFKNRPSRKTSGKRSGRTMVETE
ncbi:MAG: type II toxin-antitoxin system HicB family antitoxin [Planctomycetaceae bacterium]|nr:type II toxin-antitoxin system HicB family antitoxin [Planctomycetaceae bacterium]